ncbi:MAG: enolase C-terminal domain-like protein [Nocardioidaceae bacterium]
MPVHDLIGGLVRDRVQGYVWLGCEASDDEPDAVAAEALARMREGVDAFKLTAPSFPPTGYGSRLQLVYDQMAATRAAVGPERDIALDCHGRTDPRQAGELLRVLTPLRPLFVEEPVLPELTDELEALCAHTNIPIAAGERAFDRHESWRLLEAGVQVLQPDVAQSGGISELMRICTIASLTGARVAPHCAIGPLALAASIQIGLAAPEALIQEDPAMPDERSVFDGYLTDSSLLHMDHGYFVPNGAPGLGVEVI